MELTQTQVLAGNLVRMDLLFHNSWNTDGIILQATRDGVYVEDASGNRFYKDPKFDTFLTKEAWDMPVLPAQTNLPASIVINMPASCSGWYVFHYRDYYPLYFSIC